MAEELLLRAAAAGDIEEARAECGRGRGIAGRARRAECHRREVAPTPTFQACKKGAAGVSSCMTVSPRAGTRREALSACVSVCSTTRQGQRRGASAELYRHLR